MSAKLRLVKATLAPSGPVAPRRADNNNCHHHHLPLRARRLVVRARAKRRVSWRDWWADVLYLVRG
jgi:hypothetical protein